MTPGLQSVEVHGSTGDARSAPSELADFFQLDKTARVQEIMDRLAQLRAQACVQALMTLGVSEKRLWATFHGRGGKVAQKADFIPHSSRNRERYKPLPPGIPFRVLHVRRYDNNLQLVMTRVRAFMETHDVHFNGAGDEGLPSAEQAWSVDHLDPGVREANWRTLEGIAAILREFQDVVSVPLASRPLMCLGGLWMCSVRRLSPQKDKLSTAQCVLLFFP